MSDRPQPRCAGHGVRERRIASDAVRGLVALFLLFGSATLARAAVPPHWIVSTHDCDQRTDGWCDRDCPRTFVRQPGGEPREVPRGTFETSLRPGAPVVVFVHGSFLKWEDSLERARTTFTWLEEQRKGGVQPHYVGFSWPSHSVTGVLPGVDVNILGRRAQLNGYYLARFVNGLPAGTPVTFVGHSHGTRVAAGALHVLGGGTLWRHGIPRDQLRGHRVRTVFAAAAMDHHWMNPGERYQNAWFVVDGLVHLKNPRDVALDLYPLRKPFSKRALGQVGFNAAQLNTLGRYAAGVIELDVSQLLGKSHAMAAYQEKTELSRYLAPYVFHEVPVVTRQAARPANGDR